MLPAVREPPWTSTWRRLAADASTAATVYRRSEAVALYGEVRPSRPEACPVPGIRLPPDAAPGHRNPPAYGAELKVQILAECDRPGASVAKGAMAHGINANIVQG
jgi:hypothetical protein